MSRYLPTLLRTCNQSTNKHYKLAAGLIRNGRLVSVSANKSSIHDHAERLAVKKYFERCKEQKESGELHYYSNSPWELWTNHELETLYPML